MNSLTGIAIYTEAEVIQAFRNSLGNYDLAAKELKVSRGELVTFTSNHPEVLEARIQIKEGIKDEMEDLLIQGARTDNTLLMFFLKTQAPERGYGNKSHSVLSGPDGKPIQVNVNARALIAAFQRGFDSVEEEEEEQDVQSEYSPERQLLQ